MVATAGLLQHSLKMRKKCPDCKTVSIGPVGYCEACAFQFRDTRHQQDEMGWQYWLASIVLGLSAAICEFLALR
jgi:hypothetical protein